MATGGRKALNDPQGISATKALAISAGSNLPNILRRRQTVGQANPTVAAWIIPVCAWPKESISLGEMWIETGRPLLSRAANGARRTTRCGWCCYFHQPQKPGAFFILGFHLHPKSGAFGRLALIRSEERRVGKE